MRSSWKLNFGCRVCESGAIGQFLGGSAPSWEGQGPAPPEPHPSLGDSQWADCAEQLVSNGILAARELSRLHVRLEEAGDQKGSEGKVQLVVPGSCEGPQEASVGTSSFCFHCLACWEQELNVHLQDAPQEQLKVPLKALPSGQVVRLVFPTSQEPLMKMELKKEEGPKELAVRLGCGPCAEEQAFLSRRKQVVAKALKQALQLDGDLQEDEVWGLGWREQASLDLLGPTARC